MTQKRNEIFEAIEREREYQDLKAVKNGWQKEKRIAEFLLVMRAEIAEAEEAWLKKTHDEIMREILQVVSVGVAAMEVHGLFERSPLEFKLMKSPLK